MGGSRNDYAAMRPEKTLFWGYLGYVLLGALFLSLPGFRIAGVSAVDSLFVAVSAVSTTGLSPISVAQCYSFLGQLVILLLIQLGGIGYMTFGSFIVLSTRIHFSEGREMVHKTVFSLPKDFSVKKFIRSVIAFTVAIEAIGAVLLSFAFSSDGRQGVAWTSIFHSVSAFCTAGFSLYDDNLEAFRGDAYLNAVIGALSFLGAIGYIVLVDIWLYLRNKKRHITFTSLIILGTTAILFAFGSFILIVERTRADGAISWGLVLESCFQSMSALTTVGFNTIPIHALGSASLFAIMILMIVGASPSGTGGGIKSTTVSALTGVLRSVFSSRKDFVEYTIVDEPNAPPKGPVDYRKRRLFDFFIKVRGLETEPGAEEAHKRDEELAYVFGDIFKIELSGRSIPLDRVVHAIATFAFYFVILFLGVLAMLTVETADFRSVFFEAASALGTVGLSTGITADLSVPGKLIAIVLMFIGRLGPLSFGVILFDRKNTYRSDRHDDLVI